MPPAPASPERTDVRYAVPPMPTRPAPKTAFHHLEVLTRRGQIQAAVARKLALPGGDIEV